MRSAAASISSVVVKALPHSRAMRRNGALVIPAMGANRARAVISTGPMFMAGFSTFALVYCVQPLMPELSRTFRVSAATSSLSLSVTTGVLAGALLVVGALAESWGRKGIMTGALVTAALLTLCTAVVPSWHALQFKR